MFQHDMLPSPVQRQHVCGACGHIMITGDGTTLKLQSRRELRRKQGNQQQTPSRVQDQAAERVKTVTCGRCSKTTTADLAPPDRIVRRKAARQPDQAKAQPSGTPKPVTANASSKKRAKNRKAGLQALLSGQQQQKANPLTLGDFMRK